MTRKHRRMHRIVWPMLAIAVSLAFISALILRAPQEAPPPAAQEQTQ